MINTQTYRHMKTIPQNEMRHPTSKLCSVSKRNKNFSVIKIGEINLIGKMIVSK
jgi:hypothetical protein